MNSVSTLVHKRKNMKKIMLYVTLILLLFTAVSHSGPRPEVEDVSGDIRCPVCGMFVAKYQNWVTQLQLSNGSRKVFDGVKDMMVFYFSPQAYGLDKTVTVKEVWVKDYYSLDWIDGQKALYVRGSDVHGPMGHELIPFVNRAGAENFEKDHHGKEIVDFDTITEEMISSMRKGHKMKGHVMNKKK